jgi:hypothetical protein
MTSADIQKHNPMMTLEQFHISSIMAATQEASFTLQLKNAYPLETELNS